MDQETNLAVIGSGCDKCGHDHNGRCRAHRTRRDDDGKLQPCKRWPTRGLTVCTNHGGGTRQSRAAGQRNLTHLQTMQAAMSFGIPRHVDPADGLVQEYWLCAGLVEFYGQRVREIERRDGHEGLVFGVVERSEELDTGEGVAEAASDGSVSRVPSLKSKTVRRSAPNVWLNLLNAERDRYTKLGIEISKLGLEARRDEYIRLHVTAFIGVLDQLQLTDEQRAVAGRLLRELDTAHAS
jgi:hypothetical protein